MAFSTIVVDIYWFKTWNLLEQIRKVHYKPGNLEDESNQFVWRFSKGFLAKRTYLVPSIRGHP